MLKTENIKLRNEIKELDEEIEKYRKLLTVILDEVPECSQFIHEGINSLEIDF